MEFFEAASCVPLIFRRAPYGNLVLAYTNAGYAVLRARGCVKPTFNAAGRVSNTTLKRHIRTGKRRLGGGTCRRHTLFMKLLLKLSLPLQRSL